MEEKLRLITLKKEDLEKKIAAKKQEYELKKLNIEIKKENREKKIKDLNMKISEEEQKIIDYQAKIEKSKKNKDKLVGEIKEVETILNDKKVLETYLNNINVINIESKKELTEKILKLEKRNQDITIAINR